MMPKLTKPIAEFMHSCNQLLTDPITHDTLTKEELDILQTCIQLLTKRFFDQPSGEMSGKPPGGIAPPGVALPHGSGDAVE
jgi:hypothetical protein